MVFKPVELNLVDRFLTTMPWFTNFNQLNMFQVKKYLQLNQKTIIGINNLHFRSDSIPLRMIFIKFEAVPPKNAEGDTFLAAVCCKKLSACAAITFRHCT